MRGNANAHAHASALTSVVIVRYRTASTEVERLLREKLRRTPMYPALPIATAPNNAAHIHAPKLCQYVTTVRGWARSTAMSAGACRSASLHAIAPDAKPSGTKSATRILPVRCAPPRRVPLRLNPLRSTIRRRLLDRTSANPRLD